MLGIMLTGYVIKTVYDPQELYNPFISATSGVSKVYASEPTKQPQTIEDQIRSIFTDNPDEAIHVAFCESSLRPWAAHTESSAKGLFQIIKGTWKSNKCEGDPLSASDNIKCAKKIYDRQGWRPWLASNNCHKLLGVK